MSKTLAALNLVFASVLMLLGFAAIISLPSALDRFSVEPEDVYALIFGAVVCGSLALVQVLVAGALVDFITQRRRAIFWLGVGATGILTCLSLLAWSDAAARPIVLPTILLALSSFQLTRVPHPHQP